MITVREVIYNFKELLDRERLSDQVGFSNRFIYNHILNLRAMLIKRKKNESKLSNIGYQTYTLELEEVTDQEMPCVDSSNCILLRTKVPIQSYIDLKSVTTPINKSGEVEKLSEIDPDLIKYKLISKIPSQSNKMYYYLQNTGEGVYIYIWSNKALFLESISIKAIFYSPHLVEAIKDCGGALDPCYNYLNALFPIEPELLTEVYALAINTLLRARTPASDIHNDNNETNVSNPGPFK